MEVVSRHFSSIDSTNSWGKLHLDSFDRNKITMITADGQTGGRGQFNRKWISPSGLNIYATFCFFMELGRSDIVNIPQLLALSTLKALEKNGFHAKIKWPNDLMLSGKKLGGILCETTPIEGKLGIVLGIGLNVNMESDLLEQIDQPATSLAHEKGASLDRKAILKTISEYFIQDIEIFLNQGFAPFEKLLKKYLIQI